MTLNGLVRLFAGVMWLFGITAYADEASFMGLGDLPGGIVGSTAYAVSADGTTVVGTSSSVLSGFGYEAFRWTKATGMVGLGDLPGGFHSSNATGVSGDGTIVVGSGTIGTMPQRSVATRWTASEGLVSLGTLPGGDSSGALGVSADGGTIVGSSSKAGFQVEAFRWTSAGGMQGIGDLPLGPFRSEAYAVSSDGSVVVGYGSGIFGAQAFHWTQGQGMTALLPGAAGARIGRPNALSADGSVVVSGGTLGVPGPGTQGFRVADGQAVSLGGIFGSYPAAISADGSRVVGTRWAGDQNAAFIWDEAHGMRNLQDVLVNDFGMDLSGWNLGIASGISADGRTIVGGGSGPRGGEAWLAFVPSFPASKPWSIDSNGNWSTAGNWTAGTPNSAGAEATFGGVITQPRTVTIDVPVTIGRIDFENINVYTVAGTSALTFDASGEARINVRSGSHTISAPVTLLDHAVITVTPEASNLAITGAITAAGRYLLKEGAGTLTLNNVRALALSVRGGAVEIAPNGTVAGTSAISELTIAGIPDSWTARLDLTNNDAVLHSSAANKSANLARLYNQLKHGFNNGDWRGLGISSTAAATNANADTGLTLVDNALLGYSDFSGQPVTADSILLKYTYYGDIDQNGQVDADDLTVFASNFGRTSGATQVDGDIDFNGAVNADDLTVFANNFNKGVGNPLVAAGVQAVPEPRTWALAVCALVAVVLLTVRHHPAAAGGAMFDNQNANAKNLSSPPRSPGWSDV